MNYKIHFYDKILFLLVFYRDKTKKLKKISKKKHRYFG